MNVEQYTDSPQVRYNVIDLHNSPPDQCPSYITNRVKMTQPCLAAQYRFLV